MKRRAASVLVCVLMSCSSESTPSEGEPTAEVPRSLDAGSVPLRDASAPPRSSTLDAGTRAPSAPLCKAGYYVGHMEGMHRPGFASWGITQSPFAVQFESESRNGQPPLALTFVEELMGSGEFTTFSVSGGCMQGLARSGNTDNPFVARLAGELDCKTGMFNGTMRGVYTLLDIPGLEYTFEGPFTARFADGELRDGAWSAEEPAALDGNPSGSGSGTWGATWNADEAPAADSDPCAKVPLPADAGSP